MVNFKPRVQLMLTIPAFPALPRCDKFLLGFTGDGTNTRIDTSLDTVEGSATEREQNLRVFAELVRGILTKAPCKNEVFYGIGRKNS
jgi:hypothetical protein